MVELESSRLAQASSHARAATSTPVDWSHGLYIHAHPLQSKNLIVLVFTSPTASNHPPPPSVWNVMVGHIQMQWSGVWDATVGACGMRQSGVWEDAMVGHVGHNGQAYGTQWLGVSDAMVGACGT